MPDHLSGNTWDYRWCPGERWDQQFAQTVPETSYAPCGDLSLAYQVFGDGPVELVFVGPMVTHIELLWTLPEFKAFFEQLATFCRVLLFDKAGVGLSDPIPKVRLLEERAAEIEAVMDAVGFGRAALFGVSEGGPAGNPLPGCSRSAIAGPGPTAAPAILSSSTPTRCMTGGPAPRRGSAIAWSTSSRA